MIPFEVRWNPETDKWQYRGPQTVWSEPMPLWKCQKAMKAEVALSAGCSNAQHAIQ